MAGLTAKFKLVDEMSEKLEKIAQAGQKTTDQWENAGKAVSGAFADASSQMSAVEKIVQRTQKVLDEYNESSKNIVIGTSLEDETLNDISDLLTGKYKIQDDKISYKLDTSREANEYTENRANELREQFKGTFSEGVGLLNVLEDGGIDTNSLEEVSALNEVASKVLEANNNIKIAEENVKNAENELGTSFDDLEEGTITLGEYEQSVNNVCAAHDVFAEAVEEGYIAYKDFADATGDVAEVAEEAGLLVAEEAEQVGEASEQVGEATEQVSEESQEAKTTGVDAINSVASALAAAGITKMLKEVAQAVYELTTSFSDAESTIVVATGATGESLDSLTESMMNVYSVSKTGSLDDTASAVGEINTRLGYTDEQLEDTTELFLDFADVTGESTSSAVRTVTQLMNQWNVDASEMESMLSKLTYAGQASGISVSTLSSQLTSNKGILDQLGFSLDEATAMFMNMELQGTNTSQVMMGFRSALSSGAISSLDDLYEVLDRAEQGLLSVEEASDIFGARAGVAIVNAAQGGVFNLDEFTGALENADGTLETTAESAQTLDEKWEQATNNIGAAFTNSVEPGLSALSEGFADLFNNIGTFLNETPIVTQILTAIGIAIGVVVAGIAGVSFVTEVAIPLVISLGTAFNTALGPIGWIALGITAVVTAATAFCAMSSDVEDETEDLTATSKAQYEELQDLNAEYDEACKKYGETSEEASRLKYQVDDLSDAYEANKQTLEDFITEGDELCTSIEETWEEYDEETQKIKDNELEVFALCQKIDDLTGANGKLAGSQKEVNSLLEQLSELVPDATFTYEDFGGNTDAYLEYIKGVAEEQANEEQLANVTEKYTKTLGKKQKLENKITAAEKEIEAEREDYGLEYNKELDEWGTYTATSTTGGEYTWVSEDALPTTTRIGELHAKIDEWQASYDETETKLSNLEKKYDNLTDAGEENGDTLVTQSEAITTAIEKEKDEIDKAAEKYDEAYETALESFQGQFGLFDEASTESEDYMNATVSNAQSALDSQLDYWNTYSSNISVLKNTSADDLGITQKQYKNLMSYVQDGSEEAAGLAASMVKSIENGDSDAVSQLAVTATKVSNKQEKLAEKTAKWSTNYEKKLSKIQKKLEKTVEKMNMDEESKSAAKATIDAYIAEIEAGTSGAASAAAAVKAATEAALSGDILPDEDTTNGVVSAGKNAVKGKVVKGNATGTTYSDDVFIAGEEGPELIIGKKGSTVFPTSETDRIIEALNSTSGTVKVQQTTASVEKTAKDTESTKRIYLEIAGSGAIELSGNSDVDKDKVIKLLYSHMEPVLSEILTQEAYEEGDYSYEY